MESEVLRSGSSSRHENKTFGHSRNVAALSCSSRKAPPLPVMVLEDVYIGLFSLRELPPSFHNFRFIYQNYLDIVHGKFFFSEKD